MDVQYVANEGALLVTLSPADIEKFAVNFQLLLEDEKLKTLVRVPHFSEDFFRKLYATQEKIGIKFTAEYLEFGVALLEDISLDIAQSGGDTSNLESFLDQVEQFCAPSPTSH